MASEIHRKRSTQEPPPDAKRVYQASPPQNLEERYAQLARSWHDVVRQLNQCRWGADVLTEETRVRGKDNTTLHQKMETLQAELDQAWVTIRTLSTLGPIVRRLREELAHCRGDRGQRLGGVDYASKVSPKA